MLLFLLFAIEHITVAQICTGSLGDPVININFGSGFNPGPALNAKLPNLLYQPNDCPLDGYYTIINNTSNCFGGSWHNVLSDHTGNSNGYMMLINASLNSGDFYIDTVDGLCSGTTYEFAAWVLNVLKSSACNSQGISPNLTFQIESGTGVVLGTYKTGDIPQSNSPAWKQYGLFFTTPPNAQAVILRITNNAPGGCGNDLAIDDITFRPCGPLINASVAAVNGANACEGDTTSFALKSVLSAGYIIPAFQWQLSTDNGLNWSDIPGANSQTYIRKPTAAGTYLYRVTASETGNITRVNCRVASNNITVNVYTNPATTATNDGPKCIGNSTTLTATGGTNYHWTGPGFVADGNTVITLPKQTTATYYVKVTNVNGCSKLDSTVVKTLDRPVAGITTSNPLCPATNVLFTDKSTIAAGYTIAKWQWSFGDGGNSAFQNTSHAYAVANMYDVSLVVTSDKGCSDTAKQSITINPLPQVNFGLPKVCLSDPFALFTDSSTIADNSQAGFTYLWNFGDANATPANPNTSTAKDPKHSYSATGVYPVNMAVTSAKGCRADTTKQFTVNGALPAAGFTIDPGNLCSNLPVTLTNNSSVNFGTITRLQLFWDVNDANSKITDDAPVTGKKYTHSYAVFGNPSTKTYQVKMVAYSGINCINEFTQPIILKASPQVVFTTLSPVCADAAAFLITAASENGGLPGRGVFSGDGVDSNGLFSPATAAAGQHLLRYTYTGTNGCTSFAEQNITVYPQPLVNAGPDRTLLEGGFITLEATASGNSLNYLWSPAQGIDNPAILQPKVSTLADQVYTLTVKSSDNCTSSDDVLVTVLKTPVVPNAFSPNGDGINDRWTIRYLDSYPGVTVRVFDRYGRQVYQSTGYNTPWDGKLNGKTLPVGTYYYIIDRKIAAKILTGSVTIIQ